MPLCILLVEDDEYLRGRGLKKIREAYPRCDVKACGNQTEAAELIGKHLFAVVVTDVDLTKEGGSPTGGFDVVKSARDRDPDSQVIVVTFKLTTDYLRQSRELTAFSYINRGIPNHDLFLLDEIAEGLRRFEALRAMGVALTVGIPGQRNGPLTYRLSTRAGGSETCAAVAGFDVSQWKELAAAIGSMAARSPDGSWDALPKFIGREMWNRLFGDHEELLIALGEANARAVSSERVVMKFQCENHALDVPFELINNGRGYLAVRQPLVVVPTRIDNAPPPFRNIRDAGPLRALLIAADTRTFELGPIPAVDEEIKMIAAILGRDRPESERQLDRIVQVHSWEPLSRVRELLKEPWHIIHFACHGTFRDKHPEWSGLHYWEKGCSEQDWLAASVSQENSNGWEWARDEKDWENIPANTTVRHLRGKVVTLTAKELGESLKDRRPGIVYLNCCQSGRTARAGAIFHGELLSLMDAAINAGVSVVVGNRWPVRDDQVTLQMIDCFYDTLRREHTPEYALYRARRVAYAHAPDVITWASPVMALSS